MERKSLIKKFEKILYVITETGCYGSYDKINKNCNEMIPLPICVLCKEFTHKYKRSKADVVKLWKEIKESK